MVDAHICFSSHTSDLESLVRNYRSTVSTIKPDKSTVQLSKQVQNKSKCSKITGQSQIAVMRLLIQILGKIQIQDHTYVSQSPKWPYIRVEHRGVARSQ